MVAIAVLGAAMVAGLGPADGPSPEILAEYKTRAAQTAPDAAAQLRLALWCERNGLAPERIRHLGRAMMADPANVAARGLLGLMADGGTWRRPEAVVERLTDEPARLATLAEYRARRDPALLVDKPESADAHLDLARWCEAAGLDAESEAHYRSVVRLDPSREPVWKHLGYKKKDGRWTTDAQLAAERADAAAQRDADKFWLPRLQKLKARLARSKDRESAEAELSSIADPRAVPSVVRVFATSRPADQANAVQILGQIDAPSASRALATIAVLSDEGEVRRRAIETLRGRDAREFAGRLVAMVRKPLRYEVRPVGGPGEPGGLFVEGERYNVRRQYVVPAPPHPTSFDYRGRTPPYPVVTVSGGNIQHLSYELGWVDEVRVDPAISSLARSMIERPSEAVQLLAGAPRRQAPGYQPPVAGTAGPNLNVVLGRVIDRVALENQAAANDAWLDAQRRIAADVAEIDATNDSIAWTNDRVLSVLRPVSGHDAKADPESWRAWWVDTLGYAYIPPSQYKPTFDQNVVMPAGYRLVRTVSCFGAGTPVWAQDGRRAIESLRVGDLVLAQDTATGELGYRPVTVVHHNPPSKTFVVRVEGEEIVSSPFHRFWAVGRGWVMARDLKAGDRLRNLGRTALVESVDEGPEQLVYNLDVAGSHSFFVGEQGALVHDNTLPDLVAARFDATTGDE